MTDTPPPTPLTYATGVRPYGGMRDVPGTARLLGVAAAVSVVATVFPLVALFVGSGLLILASPLAQAVALAAGIGITFQRLAVRQRWALNAVATLAAVLSIVLTHGALYVHDLYLITEQVYPDALGKRIGLLADGTAGRLHAAFIPHDWPGGGVVNNSVSRANQSNAFGVMTLVHAAMMVIATRVSVKEADKRVWCDACGAPLPDATNLLIVDGPQTDRLAAAVVDADQDRAAALAVEAAGVSFGSSCGIARLFACASCGHRTVDVVRKDFAGGGTVPRTRRIEAEDAMVTALRSVPAECVDTIEATSPSDARGD